MKMNSKKQYLILLGALQLAFSSIALDSNQRASDCEFAIIMPSYNNEKYYIENLDSVCWQKSTNPYHIYYINDCSTDATGKLVEEYIQENGLQEKFTLINNTTNKGGGANIYNTVHEYIEDHKIVVILDGDDLFPNNEVLLTLENYYSDPDLWMTHGVLETFPDTMYMGQEIPDWVSQENRIRTDSHTTALRTFKAGLYKKVKKEDFYYNGEFMKVTWDLAFMLPMLEMCNPKDGIGKKHYAYVSEVLYRYRFNNPLSDFRVRGELQLEVDRYVRGKTPYEPLDQLVLPKKKQINLKVDTSKKSKKSN